MSASGPRPGAVNNGSPPEGHVNPPAPHMPVIDLSAFRAAPPSRCGTRTRGREAKHHARAAFARGVRDQRCGRSRRE
eukprot:1440920-Alexandrium_andersonii.AAC.1